LDFKDEIHQERRIAQTFTEVAYVSQYPSCLAVFFTDNPPTDNSDNSNNSNNSNNNSDNSDNSGNSGNSSNSGGGDNNNSGGGECSRPACAKVRLHAEAFGCFTSFHSPHASCAPGRHSENMPCSRPSLSGTVRCLVLALALPPDFGQTQDTIVFPDDGTLLQTTTLCCKRRRLVANDDASCFTFHILPGSRSRLPAVPSVIKMDAAVFRVTRISDIRVTVQSRGMKKRTLTIH